MAPLVWLVTGCSSGFGEQFVHQAIARGDKVVATGRNAATKLAHLKDTGASILDLDVTAPQAEIDAQIQKAVAVYGHVDILVNNAGNVVMGFAEDAPQELMEGQLATNLYGSINVTRALLPHFRARKSGKIAFTSSIFSWFSVPGNAPYAMSKHAIAAYAEALAYEVGHLGIQVISFDIGHFRTAVADNMTMKIPEDPDYKPVVDLLAPMAAGIANNQPGDPVKGVKVMIDVLTSEKRLPLRVPVGADAAKLIRDYCDRQLKWISEWEDVTCNTDFPGPKQGFFAQVDSYLI